MSFRARSSVFSLCSSSFSTLTGDQFPKRNQGVEKTVLGDFRGEFPFIDKRRPNRFALGDAEPFDFLADFILDGCRNNRPPFYFHDVCGGSRLHQQVDLHALSALCRVSRERRGVPYENYPVKCCRALNYLDWNIFACGPFAQPVCHARPDDWAKGRVFNLCGQDIPLLSDAGIEAMLARPVLVDGEAAKALTKRGFAPLLGIEADDGDDAFSFSSEHVKSSGIQVGFMWEATCARLKPLSEGVRVAAEFCRNLSFGPDQTPVAPSMTFFTNRLGGRVATVGWSVTAPYHKMYRNPTARASAGRR